MTKSNPVRVSFPLVRALGSLLSTGLCALALTLSATSLHAQSTNGTVTGSVIDASTGKFLEGASVTVEGSAARAITERQGAFVLRDVAAGPHNIVVTYPGLEPASTPVIVTTGQSANLAIRLGASSEVITLSEFKVAGTKEGMAQAIALQKSSDNVKVVAAGDQYGDIAEGNAAEYLKFLPGVGVDFNANDARAATLRGLATQFTNVTMNGNPIASATSGNLNRRFEFEQVAINNVESVEVIKTLTPDMPATSTGGSINMVTKSAFDRQGSLLTYRAYFQAMDSDLYLKKTEGWGQEQTRKVVPGLDLDYSTRLTPNLGIDVGYKNSQLYNNYLNPSYSWQYNPASGGTPDHPWLNSFKMALQNKITRRQALSGQVDYKFDDNTKISLTGAWNFYDLLFSDRIITLTPGNRAALATTTPITYGNDGNFNGLPAAGNVAYQGDTRWKSGVTWNSGLNFSHNFTNGSKLEASTYWSQAYSKYRDTTGSFYRIAVSTRTGLGINFTDIGASAPKYTAFDSTGAVADLRDINTGFALSSVTSMPQTGVDTRYGVGADYKFPFATKLPITLKVGARLDETTRNIENHAFGRSGTTVATGFGGTSAVAGAALVAINDNGFANHPLGFGVPAYNIPSPYRAFTSLGGANYLPWIPASDTIARFDEETKSAYFRVDAKPTSKLLVVAGYRHEDRVTDVQNRLTTLPRVITGKFTDKSWFPSINLKYNASDSLQFRFGAAKSIGLPDYLDLLPGAPTIVDPAAGSRGKISLFNPGLEAYDVVSFDAGVEYYFSHSGYVSASIFRKRLKNYIVDTTQTLDAPTASGLGITQNQLGAAFDQYDVSYKFNVPDAGSYKGIELGYSQNFSFLPKPFNTLGLQFNATFISIDPINSKATFSNSDANLNAAILKQIGRNLELSSVKESFNVTLNYSIGKVGFTVTSNYTGYVLKTVNRATVKYTDAPNQYFLENQYQAPRELIDLRIDYKWDRKFTPYFQARNILGRDIVTSTKALLINRSDYGDPIYELGVRGVW